MGTGRGKAGLKAKRKGEGGCCKAEDERELVEAKEGRTGRQGWKLGAWGEERLG